MYKILTIYKAVDGCWAVEMPVDGRLFFVGEIVIDNGQCRFFADGNKKRGLPLQALRELSEFIDQKNKGE